MTSLVLTYLFHVLPALTSHSFAEMSGSQGLTLPTRYEDVCNQPHFHAGDDRERCLDAYLALGKLLNTFSREVGFGCFYESGKGF